MVPRSRAPRFPLLDSVRAIAALAVVCLHSLVFAGATWTTTLAAPVVARLDVGVTVFFLLSGFLLYRPFVRARLVGERSPHSGPYAWRRVLRIVPAYWVALTVSALWLGQKDVLDPAHGVVYYAFAQLYDPSRSLGGLPQAWSLNVEMTFYLFLPLWAWLMRRRDRGRPGTVRSELVALGVLAAVGAAYEIVLLATASDPARANNVHGLSWLPGFFDHFALGMAIAVISVWVELRGGLPRALGWLDRRAWPAWALALVAYAVVCYGIGLHGVGILGEPMTAKQALARHWLYALVALGVLLPAVLGRTDVGAIRTKVLANRHLLWIGLISYGVYLWHYPVVEQAWRWKLWNLPGHPYPVFLAMGLAGGIGLAAVSYYVLERPLLRFKRLVPDRQSPPHDPTTHVPLEPEPVPVPLAPVAAERATGR